MAEPMPESSTNGPTNGDVDMKEEPPAEETSSLNSIQQADPTDPNPPPQASSSNSAPVAAAAAAPEHLSNIAPAVAQASPAAATRPSSMPPQPTARPEKPIAHGGPTRQYLNAKVTPHLLEGMKYLAVYEPEKPLDWLADFLKKRSQEVEG